MTASQLRKASGEMSLTSALRLQRRMADIGVVRRLSDPKDRRRTLIELTPAGEQKLEAYLDHLLATYLATAKVDLSADQRGSLRRLEDRLIVD